MVTAFTRDACGETADWPGSPPGRKAAPESAREASKGSQCMDLHDCLPPPSSKSKARGTDRSRGDNENTLLTTTAGEAVINHRFIEFQPFKGNIPGRNSGSLISMENGTSIPYSLDKLKDRGKFFINPGENIYTGQVIGENSRGDDLVINVTKTKKLSNVRSAGTDDKVKLAPPLKFTLEEAIEYIQKDEYVEVTPNSIRLRKILLNENDRKRSEKEINSHS